MSALHATQCAGSCRRQVQCHSKPCMHFLVSRLGSLLDRRVSSTVKSCPRDHLGNLAARTNMLVGLRKGTFRLVPLDIQAERNMVGKRYRPSHDLAEYRITGIKHQKRVGEKREILRTSSYSIARRDHALSRAYI